MSSEAFLRGGGGALLYAGPGKPPRLSEDPCEEPPPPPNQFLAIAALLTSQLETTRLIGTLTWAGVETTADLGLVS
jgi:hypothetical protein